MVIFLVPALAKAPRMQIFCHLYMFSAQILQVSIKNQPFPMCFGSHLYFSLSCFTLSLSLFVNLEEIFPQT